jgi:hypothetical protein
MSDTISTIPSTYIIAFYTADKYLDAPIQLVSLCGLPVPRETDILLRLIWEAICHRLGVSILRMILETEVAHERVSEVSQGEMRILHTLVLG